MSLPWSDTGGPKKVIDLGEGLGRVEDIRCRPNLLGVDIACIRGTNDGDNQELDLSVCKEVLGNFGDAQRLKLFTDK